MCQLSFRIFVLFCFVFVLLCLFFVVVVFYIRCGLGGTVYICECKFVYMSEREGVGVKVCVIVKCKRKYARYSVQ